MESAWRRLREVLDGPDVAAALVERQAGPRHMADAPRDGTFVYLDFGDGRGTPYAKWGYPNLGGGGLTWVDQHNASVMGGRLPIGWWPTPPAVLPMSDAPRDGTWIDGRVKGGGIVVIRWRASRNSWRDGPGMLWPDDMLTGWSPVK
jgi:hypothetical protein